MRKLLGIFLIFAILLTFCACSKTDNKTIEPTAPIENIQNDNLHIEEDVNTSINETVNDTEGNAQQAIENKETHSSSPEILQESTFIDMSKEIAMFRPSPKMPQDENEAAEKQQYWENILYNQFTSPSSYMLCTNAGDFFTMTSVVLEEGMSALRFSFIVNDRFVAVELYGTDSYTHYHHLIEKDGEIVEKWSLVQDAPVAEDFTQEYGLMPTPPTSELNRETDTIVYIGTQDGIDYFQAAILDEGEIVEVILGLNPETNYLHNAYYEADGYDIYMEAESVDGTLFIPTDITSTVSYEKMKENAATIIATMFMSASLQLS